MIYLLVVEYYFNHEYHVRGREFVTRKITDSVAKIKQ